MNNCKNKTLLLAMPIIIILFLVFGIKGTDREMESINIKPQEFLENYYSCVIDKDMSALNALYFPPEDSSIYLKLTRDSFTSEDGTALDKYEVLSEEKLNDNLYKYNFYAQSEDGEEDRGENFVANIDGNWKVIVNSRFIPLEILDGIEMPIDEEAITLEDVMNAKNIVIK